MSPNDVLFGGPQRPGAHCHRASKQCDFSVVLLFFLEFIPLTYRFFHKIQRMSLGV